MKDLSQVLFKIPNKFEDVPFIPKDVPYEPPRFEKLDKIKNPVLVSNIGHIRNFVRAQSKIVSNSINVLLEHVPNYPGLTVEERHGTGCMNGAFGYIRHLSMRLVTRWSYVYIGDGHAFPFQQRWLGKNGRQFVVRYSSAVLNSTYLSTEELIRLEGEIAKVPELNMDEAPIEDERQHQVLEEYKPTKRGAQINVDLMNPYTTGRVTVTFPFLAIPELMLNKRWEVSEFHLDEPIRYWNEETKMVDHLEVLKWQAAEVDMATMYGSCAFQGVYDAIIAVRSFGNCFYEYGWMTPQEYLDCSFPVKCRFPIPKKGGRPGEVEDKEYTWRAYPYSGPCWRPMLELFNQLDAFDETAWRAQGLLK